MEGLGEFFYATEGEAIQHYLLSFGAWAAAVSFALMLLQALIAPLPAFAVTLGNGLLFGFFWGGCLSLLSGVAAAFLGYELARALGRGWVQGKLGEKRFLQARRWVERWGIGALVALRLIPFLPFDPLSYFLGLSPMSRRSFLLANLVGQAPGAFFYAGVGAGLAQF